MSTRTRTRIRIHIPNQYSRPHIHIRFDYLYISAEIGNLSGMIGRFQMVVYPPE